MHHTRIPVLRPLCIAVALALLWSSVAPVLAETITYPDPDAMLQSIPIPPSLILGGVMYNVVAPGGSSSGKSHVLEGNIITVNSGDSGVILPEYVFGAVNGVDADAVKNNRVFINGDTARRWVCGGFALNEYGAATTEDNSVTINGDIVTNFVYGGYAANFFGAFGAAAATGNSVTINGDIVTNFVYGGIATNYSATATAVATKNTVTISGGAEIGAAHGAYATSASGAAEASDNTVTINGGTVEYVYGGTAETHSATATAVATKNTVTISGGTVWYDVNGGYVASTSGSAPPPATTSPSRAAP